MANLGSCSVQTVVKRNPNGDCVERYDRDRIKKAILKRLKTAHESEQRASGKPFLRAPAEDLTEYFTQKVEERLEMMRVVSGLATFAPYQELIQDLVELALHEDAKLGSNAHSIDPLALWAGFINFRMGREFIRKGLITEEQFAASTVDMKKVIAIEKWNREHGCDTLEGLNEWYKGENGKALPELIRLSEEQKSEELERVADIVEKAIKEKDESGEPKLQAIIVCGPSSSGKTTTTKRLEELLNDRGLNVSFKALEIDNYFREYAEYERYVYNIDGNVVVDYNYEVPGAYREELVNAHITALLRGEEVKVPKYYFGKGYYEDNHTPFKLERTKERTEILLIDCLHGGYPDLTRAIPRERKLIVYIEAMNVVKDNDDRYTEWIDVRMMRRMERDNRTRGHPYEITLEHWWIVDRGHRYVYLLANLADIRINGGLQYELPIWKTTLESTLDGVLPRFKRNADLYDGRERILRTKRVLSQIVPATPEQIALVPSDSILREFIGGSRFDKKK